MILKTRGWRERGKDKGGEAGTDTDVVVLNAALFDNEKEERESVH